MSVEEHLSSASDVIKLYKKYGDSKALRRVAELAYRNGANRAIVSPLNGNAEWDAEVGDIRTRYGMEYLGSPLRLDFLGDSSNGHVHHGYAIVRPEANGTLVEALVPPPPEPDGSYLTCGSDLVCDCRHLPTSSDSSEVWGCTFVQQDGHSGVCAHACVRSVSLLLHSRFGLDTVTFPEITERANCSDPRSGLSIDQMKRVLMSLDCDLLEFTPRLGGSDEEESQTDDDQINLESLSSRSPSETFWSDEVIYRYVESELPVIVGIETPPDAHTFFVVGHSFDRDSWWPEAREDYYPRLSREYPWIPSSLWSGSFYIQDDNFGPYMGMAKDVCRELVDWILVPVPNSIGLVLNGEEVEAYVAYLLYDPEIMQLMVHESNTAEWKMHLLHRQIDRRVVLRTMLLKTESFLASVMRDDCTYPEEIKALYADLALPEWIWVVEVSVAELYGPAMMKLGEILIDPSAQSVDALVPLRALHLPGVFWSEPATEDPQLIDGDRPTRVYSRPSLAERSRTLGHSG